MSRRTHDGLHVPLDRHCDISVKLLRRECLDAIVGELLLDACHHVVKGDLAASYQKQGASITRLAPGVYATFSR